MLRRPRHARPAAARHPLAQALALLALTGCYGSLAAQPAPVAEPAAASPAPEAASAAAPAASAPVPPAASAASAPARGQRTPGVGGQGATIERVEITGTSTDADERRRATASKIIIGREELDRYGDASVGEVLRRLPGVTVPGAPGRGGAPRMRGLGGGYTQILIDGQRVPPGFSFETIDPEMVERIEVLRAPTAETGARAIGGTINLIMREGYRRRLNELRLGLGWEHGEYWPGFNWTRNDSDGPLTYNLAMWAALMPRRTDVHTTTTDTALDADGQPGAVTQAWREDASTFERRRQLNLNGRLQWRGSTPGDQFVLQPTVFLSSTPSEREARQVLTAGSEALAWDSARTEATSRYRNLRLGSQWRTHLTEDLVADLNGSVSQFDSRSRSTRREHDAAGTLLRTLSDDSHTRQHGLNLTGKLSATLDSGAQLVAGLELEATKRRQTRTTLQDGAPLLTDFGDELSADSERVAAFAQDEWSPARGWNVYAGLRWEGILTRGDLPDGSSPRNRSSVWTPLAHAVWKPDPQGPGQLRLSLTRSYRSPDLGNLIARPSVSSRYPTSGGNVPTSPDYAGNPALRPELASGIDVAWEHYLGEGGVLSANLFARRIRDLIRNVTTLETVSWSSEQRWVSRAQNIGNATTQGVELEARGRLDQWLAPWLSEGPRTEVRANISAYRSWVDGVPGPDNRLAEQPGLSANIGADHRFRGTPLTLGGNLNWVPGYRTQLATDRWVEAAGKRVLDVYGLWTFNPELALRVQLGNVLARDYASVSGSSASMQEVARSVTDTRPTAQLRLEIRL